MVKILKLKEKLTFDEAIRLISEQVEEITDRDLIDLVVEGYFPVYVATHNSWARKVKFVKTVEGKLLDYEDMDGSCIDALNISDEDFVFAEENYVQLDCLLRLNTKHSKVLQNRLYSIANSPPFNKQGFAIYSPPTIPNKLIYSDDQSNLWELFGVRKVDDKVEYIPTKTLPHRGSVFFRTADLEIFIKSQSEPTENIEKPLHKKEKDSLIKLIAGMFCCYYSMEEVMNNEVNAKQISDEIFEKSGISLDPDTVRKYYREAQACLKKTANEIPC